MRATAAAKGSSSGDLRAAFDTVSHSIAVYYQFAQAAILAVLSLYKIQDVRGRDLLNYVESQECLSNNDFVAIAKSLTLSWKQSFSSVDKGTVSGSEVLQEILSVA